MNIAKLIILAVIVLAILGMFLTLVLADKMNVEALYGYLSGIIIAIGAALTDFFKKSTDPPADTVSADNADTDV